MPDTIHVLIVEDSPDDAELALLHLRQAGYDVRWTRVETAAAFTRALAAGLDGTPFDIVLADYRLPQFSGLEAMRLLTASGLDIPLILISGTLGEDLAVESIKQGVTDYLLKDRLARLGAAVQRALAASAARHARAAAEAALRASEAYYRAIVDLPSAHISRWRPDLTLTFVNQAFAQAWNRRPEELVGTRWPDLLSPREREQMLTSMANLVANPRVNHGEFSNTRPDGKPHAMLWTDYPIFDDDGKLVEFQSFGQDTTALRTVEQQMHLLSRAVEQSPTSIVITSPEGVIEYVNQRTVELTGYAQDELIGRTPALLKSGNTPPTVYRELWRTILAGHEWQGELQNRKRSGELYWEAQRISPIFDAAGNITHFLAVREDVTARRATEAALRQLNEQLEQRVEERTTELRAVNAALQRAALAKDEFLASMSHELRTPLAGILGVVEGIQLLAYGPLTERQERSLETVRASGEHLLALINDILDVAKAEAGQLRPQLDRFPVGDVCDASINLVRGMAQKKRLQIAVSIHPPTMVLEADARRVKQILVNLLSNAVKFTPEDGRIGLEAVGDAAAAAVHFTVWDTGIGIAAQDLPRLFQPFTQLDSGLAREYAGTGLGLALVRNLAELHGGSVEASSVVGEGSRFVVTLPWQQPAASPAVPPAAAAPRPAPRATPLDLPPGPEHADTLVLLADDNDFMRSVYRGYLELVGFRVIEATRGSEAVQLAERERPAIILMDIQMPGMDGFGAMRRLRASPDPAVAAIPIIAVTALAMPGDRDRCLDAGADDYLAKPVPLNRLVEAIHSLLAAG